MKNTPRLLVSCCCFDNSETLAYLMWLLNVFVCHILQIIIPVVCLPVCVASPPAACSDKASWCPSISGDQCYTSDVESTCCNTCQRLKISQTSMFSQCYFCQLEQTRLAFLARY